MPSSSSSSSSSSGAAGAPAAKRQKKDKKTSADERNGEPLDIEDQIADYHRDHASVKLIREHTKTVLDAVQLTKVSGYKSFEQYMNHMWESDMLEYGVSEKDQDLMKGRTNPFKLMIEGGRLKTPMPERGFYNNRGHLAAYAMGCVEGDRAGMYTLEMYDKDNGGAVNKQLGWKRTAELREGDDPFFVNCPGPWANMPVFLTCDENGDIEFVWTHCMYRRMGLASKLLELVKEKFGATKLQPIRVLSLEASKGFFRKHFPDGRYQIC